MSITEREIFTQNKAMRKTFEWFVENRATIEKFFAKNDRKKIIFLGCGSSFMLAKSGERLFLSEQFPTSVAIAGGDYLINPEEYARLMQDSIVVVLSRSGLTSEIVRAVENMKKTTNALIVSITMLEKNTLSEMADFEISLPWAYDESVCQTRTVTNLYAAILHLHAIVFKNEAQEKELENVIEKQARFMEDNKELTQKIAAVDFDNVIVLADGVLCGIAEEGALAFTEISMISGKYFHLLDYRHGPKVLNGKKTLNIVVLRPEEDKYQADMVQDLQMQSGNVLVLDNCENNRFGTIGHVQVSCNLFACYGIPMINICQMIALEKAKITGSNPDQPKGLDAYISL